MNETLLNILLLLGFYGGGYLIMQIYQLGRRDAERKLAERYNDEDDELEDWEDEDEDEDDDEDEGIEEKAV